MTTLFGRRAVGLPRLILAAALWCTFSACQAGPLELLGGLPSVEQVALSPDGSRIVFVRTDKDTRIAAVVTLSDNKPIAILRLAESKLRDIQWADNEHLLVMTSATALPAGLIGQVSEWLMLQVWDLKSAKTKPIPQGPFTFERSDVPVMNTIDGEPMVRQVGGHTVVFVQGRVLGSDYLDAALFRADLTTGVQQLIRRGTPTTGWVVDEAGQVAAQSDYTERDQRWVLKINHGGHLREVTQSREPIQVPRILGFGPAPDTLLMATVEDGEPTWRLVSLADGTVGEPMAERADLSSPIEDPRSHRMIGGVRTDDSASYVFFDPVIQKTWAAILRAFPNEHVDFISASADFQKIIVLVEGARDGYVYRLVDLGTHEASPVGEVYTGLTQVLLKKRVTYKAADGLDIPAYLTLPAGRDPKGLPLVVLVHGGPAAEDTAAFDWWSQALADQGYAVLQPNYRGSTVTTRFRDAGFGEWGRKMQTDVSDGVRYLAKEGIVDASRVCIVGASYGGYAALAGAALEPDVYRCAVSDAGISDIRRWLDWEAAYTSLDKRGVRYWHQFLGVTGPRDPVVDSISPIKHIDAVHIPVLLIHGKDDTVVPYEQSTLMNDALRRAGKTVEMVTLKHEDHWLSRSETRRQMLETSVRFLREHNPPDPVTAPLTDSGAHPATGSMAGSAPRPPQ